MRNWYVGEKNGFGIEIKANPDFTVCLVLGSHNEEANAKLIAMAPTLLEQRAQLLAALKKLNDRLPINTFKSLREVQIENDKLIASIESTVEKS